MLNEHLWNDSIASVHTRGFLFLACKHEIKIDCSEAQSFFSGVGANKLFLTVSDCKEWNGKYKMRSMKGKVWKENKELKAMNWIDRKVAD